MMKNVVSLLPVNREGRWPLWQQLLAFVLIELLMMGGTYVANLLVYSADMGGTMGNTALSILAMTGVTALCMELQRVVTFGGAEPQKWTVLPLAAGAFALSVVGAAGGYALANVPLPLLTESQAVYDALYSVLYVLIVAAFCALIYHLRRRKSGGWTRVVLLAAAMVVLAGGLVWVNASSSQAMLGQLMAQEQAEIPIMIDFGELPEGIEIMPVGDTDGMIVLTGTLEQPGQEEPQVGASALLYLLRSIPIFFAMKRWVFPRRTDEEALL